MRKAKMFKKALSASAAVALTTLTVGLGSAPAQATGFDCATAAIWSYDGSAFTVQKINPFGSVLATVNVAMPDPIDPSYEKGSGDVAISADYQHLYFVISDGLLSVNANTGASEGITSITGAFQQGHWPFAAGVINGGNVIVDDVETDSTKWYSINPGSGVSTVWADITNAESSLPVDKRGGTWQVGADLVQAADGSVLSLATNSNYPGHDLLVRIDSSNTANMTVLGQLPDNAPNGVGMARAGDDYYYADGNNTLFQIGTVPASASDAQLTAVNAGTWAGVELWGLAGTNDSQPFATGCKFDLATGKTINTLAATGVDASAYGFAALGLLTAGAAGIAVRRRRNAA